MLPFLYVSESCTWLQSNRSSSNNMWIILFSRFFSFSEPSWLIRLFLTLYICLATSFLILTLMGAIYDVIPALLLRVCRNGSISYFLILKLSFFFLSLSKTWPPPVLENACKLCQAPTSHSCFFYYNSSRALTRRAELYFLYVENSVFNFWMIQVLIYIRKEKKNEKKKTSINVYSKLILLSLDCLSSTSIKCPFDPFLDLVKWSTSISNASEPTHNLSLIQCLSSFIFTRTLSGYFDP